MSSDAAVLAARIRAEFAELEQTVLRAEHLLSKAQRPTRIQELVIGLAACYAAFTGDIKDFCEFLDRLNSGE